MSQYVPLEKDEQKALTRWVEFNRGRWPDLEMYIHIPNEGKRSPRMGAELKEMGMKPGFPDVFIFTARHGMHGMAIEMKRTKGGTVSPEQAKWIARLDRQGYAACVCYGWEEAAKVITRYMEEREK